MHVFERETAAMAAAFVAFIIEVLIILLQTPLCDAMGSHTLEQAGI